MNGFSEYRLYLSLPNEDIRCQVNMDQSGIDIQFLEKNINNP